MFHFISLLSFILAGLIQRARAKQEKAMAEACLLHTSPDIPVS